MMRFVALDVSQRTTRAAFSKLNAAAKTDRGRALLRSALALSSEGWTGVRTSPIQWRPIGVWDMLAFQRPPE